MFNLLYSVTQLSLHSETAFPFREESNELHVNPETKVDEVIQTHNQIHIAFWFYFSERF